MDLCSLWNVVVGGFNHLFFLHGIFSFQLEEHVFFRWLEAIISKRMSLMTTIIIVVLKCVITPFPSYIYIYSIYHVITSLHLLHPIIVQLLVEPLIVLHLPVQFPGLFRWLRAPGSLGLRARSEARWPRLRGAFFRGWWRFVKGKIMEGPIFLGNLSLFSRVRERERVIYVYTFF